ncbi:MAG: 30S ribosomal protein S17 [Alphaproteobacteria bacterium MarineAlpha5_Bin11]|nr:30S ribosomal protein S17 [Pelagibacteraceae bacterium]PPR43495.1 MAG: 30S ribosomal protein S17 [Alphaproteobacteria bacterium MarineAlpha5_Bin11]PPR51761.1 MAG: 30S ribosomal protein S17 [Alphaproteobacteria bacterium MarineAlpha5_Bin10]|tara:strand:+ start:98 stop:364 length:267 start_codon:yes stop_codon:yes gene_type:complete
MPKRILSGVVVSDKSNKTIVVKVTRRVRHSFYKKIIKKSKKYSVHDELNEFKIGDNVKIQECRPISKNKTWNVITEENLNEKQRVNKT